MTPVLRKTLVSTVQVKFCRAQILGFPALILNLNLTLPPTPPAAADPRTSANTFSTPGQSFSTPGLSVSQIKATTQTELLVQYVADVAAYKCLHSAPEVEKCS